MSLQDRERIVRREAFLPPLSDPEDPLLYREGNAYQIVNKATVKMALFDESQNKAPVPDRLNFSPLRLLSNWDVRRIISLI